MEYVWAAYSVTWIFIFVYTLILGRRQANLLREVADLREAVEKGKKGKKKNKENKVPVDSAARIR